MLQTHSSPTYEPSGSFFGGSDNATRVSHLRSAAKVGTLTARQLRERGWTKRMIVRFLVKPDGFAQNPHVLTGRPMRLYHTDHYATAFQISKS